MIQSLVMAAFVATLVASQTETQKEVYPRFTEAMEDFTEDYIWEPIELTTDDNYVLTSFQIKGKDDKEMRNPPVLIQHGEGQDAASWLASLATEKDEKPFPLTLVDAGHVVYMMNSRGTEYSRKNTKLSADSKIFWDFSIEEMWRDIKANVALIQAHLGYSQLFYVGYSSGSMQMLYSLALKEPAFRDNVRRAILLAPCSAPAEEQPGALELWNSGLQIFEYGGPNWSVDKEKACTIFTSEIIDMCGNLDRFDDLQPTSLKMNTHWSQMALSKKFQLFEEDWSSKKKGTPIDVTQIETVPISLYVAHFDEVCEPAVTELLFNRLQTRQSYELFYDPSGHDLFQNTNSFAEKIIAELEINEGEAQALKLQAKDFLKRTGGYLNPADDTIYDGASWIGGSWSTLTAAAASCALMSTVLMA